MTYDLTNVRVDRLLVLYTVGRITMYHRAPMRWACRCDCGEMSYRNTRVLVRALHNPASSFPMACVSCRNAMRKSDAFRALWDRWGTLWGIRATDRLAYEVGRDLRSTFGPTDDRYAGSASVDLATAWEPSHEMVYTRSIELEEAELLGLPQDRAGMTLQQVADEFGVSRERIRQIEDSAISKLAAAFYKLDPLLFDGHYPDRTKIRAALASLGWHNDDSAPRRRSGRRPPSVSVKTGRRRPGQSRAPRSAEAHFIPDTSHTTDPFDDAATAAE